jgi:hypothetical protein
MGDKWPFQTKENRHKNDSNLCYSLKSLLTVSLAFILVELRQDPFSNVKKHRYLVSKFGGEISQ